MLESIRRLLRRTISSSATGPERWFTSDRHFNRLYPGPMRALAKRHWTPLEVAEKSAGFLVQQDGVKILDIGSGVGKFCIAATYYKPNALYYGVEQRENLVMHANDARDVLSLQNVHFMHGNFTQLQLKDYDHFYFYNSFYENLIGLERIDETIVQSKALFRSYTNHFIQQLDDMPKGTRLATYHCTQEDVPYNFELVGTEVGELLKFWIRK